MHTFLIKNVIQLYCLRHVSNNYVFIINIKMDLQEVGEGCGDWMELAQDRDRWQALVSTVMNFRVR